jgi:hypothetical protein
MKAFKIVLSISIVAILGILLFKWFDKPIEDPDSSPPPRNAFVERDSILIDSLNKMPIGIFCKAFYLKVQSAIAEDYKNGNLGLTPFNDNGIWKQKSDSHHNSQWNNILSKNLYSAYAPLFVKQAMHVFNQSEWKEQDLKFIRDEVVVLRNSPYLGSSGFVSSLDKIMAILNKYDEINYFIKECKSFAYQNYSLDSKFPNLNEKVNKSRAYLLNNLDNSYVNNCYRLRTELQNVPITLFEKHISYLATKIAKQHSKESLRKHPGQPAYSENLYNPLRNQVDELDNNVYGISPSSFNNGFERVREKLRKSKEEAYKFYSR